MGIDRRRYKYARIPPAPIPSLLSSALLCQRYDVHGNHRFVERSKRGSNKWECALSLRKFVKLFLPDRGFLLGASLMKAAIYAVLVGLGVALGLSVPWMFLATANVRLSPNVPWSAPV